MRHALLHLLTPALLAASACATAQPVAKPVTDVVESAPAGERPEKIHVDAGGLHPASSTRTIGDQRALAPKLLASVSLERSALVGEGSVEPWLSRVLTAWLIDHGAEVRGEVAANARLVGVRFATLKQDVTIAVAPADNGDGYFVRYWAGDKDMSECAPAMKVPMTYVQLEGVLLDANQRFVASFAEVVAAPPPELKIELELKGREPCDAIAAAFADDFAPSEAELVKAATEALDAGFRAIVVPPPP